MTCKEIQQLIITDYIDNQANPDTVHRVDEHLKTCTKCAVFKKAVLDLAVSPFKEEPKEITPSAYVWNNITERLAREQERMPLASLIFERLKQSFYTKKPVLALATVSALILLVIVSAQIKRNSTMAVLDQLGNQSVIEFLAGVGDDNGNGNGFDTAVEEYLL